MACQNCGFNPCNCNNATHSFNWNTVPGQTCDDTNVVCKYTFPGQCTIYNGPALTCFGLGTGVNYDIIIASLHSIICTLLGESICVAPSALSVTDIDATTITLTWIPGGGTTLNQRILRIAKANGNVPNLTTVFSPANDLSAIASSADAQSLETNTIYKFLVQSLCPGDYSINNTNGVVEDIIFACIPEEDITTATVVNPIYAPGLVDLQVTATLPNPTPVDGGATIPGYTDFTKIEFSIYDPINLVLVKAPVTVPATSPTHLFTQLSCDSVYTLRYVLITTINGVEVRSDAIKYLGAACTKQFTVECD